MLIFDDRELLGVVKTWLHKQGYSHTASEYYHIWNPNTRFYELTLQPKKGCKDYLELVIRLKFL